MSLTCNVGVSLVPAKVTVTTLYHCTCSHLHQFAGKPSYHLCLEYKGKAAPNALQTAAKARVSTLLTKMHLSCFNLLPGAMGISCNVWLTVELRTVLCIVVL